MPSDPADLVSELRQHAASRRLPVVTNVRNILFDILVHGQDIATPLGVQRDMPGGAALTAAEQVLTMGQPSARNVPSSNSVTPQQISSGAQAKGPKYRALPFAREPLNRFADGWRVDHRHQLDQMLRQHLECRISWR